MEIGERKFAAFCSKSTKTLNMQLYLNRKEYILVHSSFFAVTVVLVAAFVLNAYVLSQIH